MIDWHPFHEVVPGNHPDQDFVAYDEGHEKSIGPVYVEQHSAQKGRWFWSMYAHSTTGRVPFKISGHEDSRGDAGQHLVEVYRLILVHNEWHPRKSPARL